jgi:FkbM family methyltransferase
MKLIRKILVKILGLKGYLRLVSRIYIISISMGWMRKKYPELFFLKKLVQPGNTVLDIGANLAYYSFFMSRAAGSNGKVYAVEPIPLFAEIWEKNMSRLKDKNYHLSNCALGTEAKEKVKMSIPIVNGIVRHGLTKVVDESDGGTATAMSFEVPMKNGDTLVQELNISKLDFIKCDVEGFEQYVIPSLKQTILLDLPVFQIELSGIDNRQNVVDFLVNLSYRIYILKEENLVNLEIKDIFNVNQDFYFLPESKREALNYLTKK